MLPVQTVMIRYMVLVYRWGRGWLGAVGAWGGALGGTVMGGGARRYLLVGRTRSGRAKAPPTWGRWGLKNRFLWGNRTNFPIIHYIFIPRVWIKNYGTFWNLVVIIFEGYITARD